MAHGKARITHQNAGMSKPSAFSVVIREIRKQRGLSQEELAELLDISVEAISKLERGVTKPRLGTIEKLSQRLKIPMNKLVGYLDAKESQDTKRIRLETALVELARKADTKTLQMMVRQFEAVIKGDN